MPLEVHCARCGTPFTPSPKDLIRAEWQLCPGCRPTPPSAKADTTPDAPPSVLPTSATETTP